MMYMYDMTWEDPYVPQLFHTCSVGSTTSKLKSKRGRKVATLGQKFNITFY